MPQTKTYFENEKYRLLLLKCSTPK